MKNNGQAILENWMKAQGLAPFAFQRDTWKAIAGGKSGLVNAPTGCGKTFSVFLGVVARYMDQYPNDYQRRKNNGLQLLWVTPLRALSKDIARAMEAALLDLDLPWKVAIRNGDTPTAERQAQKKKMPEILLITPESLHLLLTLKNYPELFQHLSLVAVDEWHELMGSKRGVQIELALSRLKAIAPKGLQVWGISATIGNLSEAAKVLLHAITPKPTLIQAKLDKKIKVHTIIPDEVDDYPWAGHLGIRLAEKILPIIAASRSTLIFINTRGMSETWYQTLLQLSPDLAGAMALHHGSIEPALRHWVENALHEGTLKAVVCTASLDLGVDFRPVDTVIQVGSSKGVSRFLQRAGRSGHQPGATSTIYFLPTHSLEILESLALQEAMGQQKMESKEPLVLCYDVLLQYLSTLSIGEGFHAPTVFAEVTQTHCFAELSSEEWQQLMALLVNGGKALQAYDEYQKLVLDNGVYRMANRQLALRHRLHIGTIVSDAMLKVRKLNGAYLGMIEEYFISRLSPGDVFTLAGYNLELVQIKDMDVLVKVSKSKKSLVPSWMGGRMSLTASLGEVLRHTFGRASNPGETSPEMQALSHLFALQAQLSALPKAGEILIEQIVDKWGYHLLVYPFEGRQVHEAMSAILAQRISRIHPLTFSISMNDYGFELLCDQPIPVDDSNVDELFSTQSLSEDMLQSINNTEMARRKFRDIAVIGGLVFPGMPGEKKKARHLQSSASLLFQVLEEYEPGHLLIRQAYQEVLFQQMEETRLRAAFARMAKSKIVLRFPEKLTPLSFPIVVDGLNRNHLSSESLVDRIAKLKQQLQGT
ncbi:MAG: ligase-associated DNA damage response DEXH box helicase [Sphingobacteriia bacterium]|nr:MAG: ligase-associated DNA damage response DEXH box helicase [Sphingobacteriia bacterium]